MNTQKKIILIKPKNDLDVYDIPLGLLHIGSVLEFNGYPVKIIDAGKNSNFKKEIQNDINNALLVGITAITTELKSAIEISDYIKKIKSEIPIIWGGWHASLFAEQTCTDKSVDFACIGEGEKVILELVKALDQNLPLGNIDGLVYKDKGVVKVNTTQII